MLITTGITNDHIYLIVTLRLMQFDFNVGQFRFGPFTKLSDIYFQNKKLSSSTQWVGWSEVPSTRDERCVYLCQVACLHVCMSALYCMLVWCDPPLPHEQPISWSCQTLVLCLSLSLASHLATIINQPAGFTILTNKWSLLNLFLSLKFRNEFLTVVGFLVKWKC